jgi:hypothetical protein
VNFWRTRLLTMSVTLHHRTCAQNQRSNPGSVARASAVAPQHVHWLRSYGADRIEERFGVSDPDSLDPLGLAEAGGTTQFRAWASAGVGVLVDDGRPDSGAAFALGSESGEKALDHRPLVTRRAAACMPSMPKVSPPFKAVYRRMKSASLTPVDWVTSMIDSLVGDGCANNGIPRTCKSCIHGDLSVKNVCDALPEANECKRFQTRFFRGPSGAGSSRRTDGPPTPMGEAHESRSQTLRIRSLRNRRHSTRSPNDGRLRKI